MDRATNASWIVEYVSKELSSAEKGLNLYRDKREIHQMLARIVSKSEKNNKHKDTSNNMTRSTFIGLQPTHC